MLKTFGFLPICFISFSTVLLSHRRTLVRLQVEKNGFPSKSPRSSARTTCASRHGSCSRTGETANERGVMVAHSASFLHLHNLTVFRVENLWFSSVSFYSFAIAVFALSTYPCTPSERRKTISALNPYASRAHCVRGTPRHLLSARLPCVRGGGAVGDGGVVPCRSKEAKYALSIGKSHGVSIFHRW